MKTQHMHHTSTNPQGKEAAMRWLAQQLRWERLLDDLRGDRTDAPPAPVDEEEAA
ncbi:MAG: hypothetical protein JO086_15260 [Acidimicrobiia bacterium]|nr:hypothetical protein [Acidimicrobiia bacterium]